MKIARSMNHGNADTPAHIIDYDDCREDRVTCLACGDRVFKVVRKGEPVQHFLSHYPFATNPRECEERVRVMQLASKSSTAKPLDEEVRRQGLKMRVRAFGRILMDQFPEVAKASNAFARRIEDATTRNPGRIMIPEVLMQLSVLGSCFQIAARKEGHEVAHSDLVLESMQSDWVANTTMMSRWGPTMLRRVSTANGTEQDLWVKGMTSLLCLASSHIPLVVLARHAWADLMLNGVIDKGQGSGQRSRALAMAKRIYDSPVHEGCVESIREVVADPFDKDLTLGDILASMVVLRMKDVLAGIDYGAKVPQNGPGSRDPRLVSAHIDGSLEGQKIIKMRDSIGKEPKLPMGRVTFARSKIVLPKTSRI